MAGLLNDQNDSINIKPHEKKKFQSKNNSFGKQEIKYEDTPLFFPPGFEKLFLLIYFVSLPYIAGLLFLFVYVATSKYETFLTLIQKSSFFMTWAIGYEILAALTLLYIVKMAITFSIRNKPGAKKNFKRPV
ncbi:hypothetical protein [Sulfurovum sp.]|jgi:small-conductance mechanosensitive channel|uniref:hypothetical protein n=1 Tax=Sulfurovum sp. TaxID=1969726 RepID=UPI002A369D90|nr:hypothetical protein [Sulfurovum sp.]MDD2450351.1 hypothetical protein [Sulfurovum sp.]MDD3500559.1 hypothetical protein [Sulfurovum sp.]MDY0401850.1 hypothetical protein [Sulfurovum sp.]